MRLETLEHIRLFLNEGLYHYAPCKGTIGGLSYQPYIAVTYIGEGRLIVDGKPRPAAEVLKEHGIEPLSIKAREGLALLSNASRFIGVGLLAVYDLIMTTRHADLCAALVCEALRSTDKAFDPHLIQLKNHMDTTETAEFLCNILSGSEIMDESRTLRVQDSMNTRIIPHVHGTAKRMAAQTYDALMEELNAVFDDPVFLPDGTALMGSNWDATAIELYCDPLAIAVMDVAKLTEVHMERLVDPHLSGLPAFLVKTPGLNNGYMITQYVTAGLLGDIALLAAPAACFNAAVSFMESDDMMYERIEAMEALVESNELLKDCPIEYTL